MNPDYRSIQRLLVANRGEIACRVMRSARALGIGSVAARKPQLLKLHCAPSFAATWLVPRLRRLLDAEGLFDPRLKRPIPFLPSTIGLITGRASAAEHDVVAVASARWPAARLAEYPDGRHELLMETPAIADAFMAEVLALFAKA